MIDHQKQDQEPSWKISFHPARTLHEKKEKKRNSHMKTIISKINSIKKSGLELQTLGNTNCFLQRSLNASLPGI
jgi:hypothetical protein